MKKEKNKQIKTIVALTITMVVFSLHNSDAQNFTIDSTAFSTSGQSIKDKFITAAGIAKYVLLVSAAVAMVVGLVKKNAKTNIEGEDATKAYSGWFVSAIAFIIASIILFAIFPNF